MHSRVARHRHPDYPRLRCGATITVEADRGRVTFLRDGIKRRKCPTCKRPLKVSDLR